MLKFALAGLADGIKEDVLGHLKLGRFQRNEEWLAYHAAFTRGCKYANWMWNLEYERV